MNHHTMVLIEAGIFSPDRSVADIHDPRPVGGLAIMGRVK